MTRLKKAMRNPDSSSSPDRPPCSDILVVLESGSCALLIFDSFRVEQGDATLTSFCRSTGIVLQSTAQLQCLSRLALSFKAEAGDGFSHEIADTELDSVLTSRSA